MAAQDLGGPHVTLHGKTRALIPAAVHHHRQFIRNGNFCTIENVTTVKISMSEGLTCVCLLFPGKAGLRVCLVVRVGAPRGPTRPHTHAPTVPAGLPSGRWVGNPHAKLELFGEGCFHVARSAICLHGSL